MLAEVSAFGAGAFNFRQLFLVGSGGADDDGNLFLGGEASHDRVAAGVLNSMTTTCPFRSGEVAP
jgi:hypothetical protein